jgi:cytochrome d ubiquinol oxidase subunit II
VAVLGGLATLAVFSLHGAIFLALKTTGELAGRARRAAEILALPAIALVAGVVIWVGVDVAGQPRPQGLSEAVPIALSAACVAALAGAGWLVARRRDLLAFVSNGVAILALTATAFTQLFPRVMVSSRAPAASLTIWNAASEHNTLVVMTVVAAIFIPLVLIYQGWSYWVFRQRLGREPMGAGSPDDGAPAAPTVASPGGSAQAPAGS